MPMPSMFNADLNALSPAQARFYNALQNRQFFKVILGASFTDLPKIGTLAKAYAQSGTNCIDVAADWDVVETVANAIRYSPHPDHAQPGSRGYSEALSGVPPILMVSVALDPDPHFQKITLNEPNCIRCGLCVPICPASALSLPETLDISQTLCYGCGRCVPVCPTDALSMLPFYNEDQVERVLSHPLVEAVEIHSTHIDPLMLRDFWQRWESGLKNKIIALCFRPGHFLVEQIIEFCKTAQELANLPILLQIDGAPMSGTNDPEASRTALEAAVYMQSILSVEVGLRDIPITISGGINAHTATNLQDERYAFIAGVGMGTVARQHIGESVGEEAKQKAKEMAQPFQTRTQPTFTLIST